MHCAMTKEDWEHVANFPLGNISQALDEDDIGRLIEIILEEKGVRLMKEQRDILDVPREISVVT